MTTEEPGLSEVQLVRQTRGLRKWLMAQEKRGRSDFVGDAARLVVGRPNIWMITGLKAPSWGGSTSGIPEGLQRVLDHAADLDTGTRIDIAGVLAHWDDIISEWHIDRDSATALADEKDMSMLAKDKITQDRMVPSAELPAPITMCIMPACRKVAVYGGERCEIHGGNWLDPQIRQAMLMTSYENLVQASDTAVETLVDVMINSRRDDARVAAAKEVLDRVGIRPGNDVHLHVHDSEAVEDTVSVIRQRLSDMHKSIHAGKMIDPSLLASSEADITDAEVIEDSADVETSTPEEGAHERESG